MPYEELLGRQRVQIPFSYYRNLNFCKNIKTKIILYANLRIKVLCKYTLQLEKVSEIWNLVLPKKNKLP